MSVRHALLALLGEAPMYGLRLRQEFEARTGDVWPLNVGQVYTTLQRLEREGNVEPDGAESGARRRFRLTAAGQAELARWLRTPSGGDTPPRDELVIKVQVALRMPEVDVHELLRVHRLHLVAAMQRYAGRRAQTPAEDLGLGLVVDAELFRLEAVVRWLDAVGARLPQPAGRSTAAAPAAGAAPAEPAPRRPQRH